MLADQISFELAIHAFAEEVVLYPIWDEIGMTDANHDAVSEHQAIKDRLVVLARTEPGEPEFEETLTRLIGEVGHHVDDEEGQELPEFRSRVGAGRMGQFGKEFLAAKRKAPTAPHPHAPDGGGLAEKVAGAIAAPLDQAKAAVSGNKTSLATDASGLLDPQAQAIVDAFSSFGPQPFEVLTPEQARRQPGPDDAVKKVMADRGLDGPEPVGSVEDVEIPDAAGGRQPVRIYRPKDVGAGPLPVILWIHGGGWVLFDIDTYDASCRGLVNKTGVIVVSSNYRRAPEAVFPASHHDVLATYRCIQATSTRAARTPPESASAGSPSGATWRPPPPAARAGRRPGARRPDLRLPLTTGEQFGDSMVDAADGRPLTFRSPHSAPTGHGAPSRRLTPPRASVTAVIQPSASRAMGGVISLPQPDRREHLVACRISTWRFIHNAIR